MGLFDGSIGAFVLGTVLSTFLLGITSTQAWYYYQSFPNDRKLYIWIVSVLLVFDWAHSAMSCYTIYNWTVSYYGDIEHLFKSPWTFAVDPAMTGIVASVVQIFYAYRVYIVGKRKPVIPIVICALSLIQCGFACGATGMIFHLDMEFARFQVWTYGVSVWLGCAALCDVMITVSLVYYLQKSKNAGVLQATNVCNRLIELIIQSNGLTASCAVIDAVLFGTLTTSYHVTVNLCLIKLYFNSLLVSLNARADLEKHLVGPRSIQFSNDGPSLMTASGFKASDLVPRLTKGTGASPVRVNVTTSQTITSDSYEKEDFASSSDILSTPTRPKRAHVLLPSPAISSNSNASSDEVTITMPSPQAV